MSDYEYTPMNMLRRYFEIVEQEDREKRKPKPPLRVEVTRRTVTFIRPETYSTSYEPSRASYDRLAALANSGAYVVEILDSGYGVAWQMRRKE